MRYDTSHEKRYLLLFYKLTSKAIQRVLNDKFRYEIEDHLSAHVLMNLLNKLSTVKPVLSGHSQKDQKWVFKTNYRLMQFKSIAECSTGSILHTFDLH